MSCHINSWPEFIPAEVFRLRRRYKRAKRSALGRLLSASERRFDTVWREWNLPDSRTRRVEDGVADSGGDHGDRGFARAGRLLVGPIDQHTLDLRDFRTESQAVVGAPVNRRHLLIVPRHFFAERPAHPLERAALQLIFHPIRARNWPAILGNDEPRRRHLPTALVDLDLGHHRDVAVVAFVGHAAEAGPRD